MYDARAVANFFIDRASKESRPTTVMTPLEGVVLRTRVALSEARQAFGWPTIRSLALWSRESGGL